MSYPFYGVTDLGYGRTTNEDYVLVRELDKNTLLAIISDGAGSHNEEFQPAQMICNEIYDYISKTVNTQGMDFIRMYSEYVLKMAVNSANRALGMFKIANEDLYGGYAASVTLCILSSDNYFVLAHSGNTRLYLMRQGFPDGLKQLTNDHTKGYDMVNDGIISEEQYYAHPDRLKVQSGLGFGAEPELQIFKGKLKPDDKILMTTDGVHYAIRPGAMSQIINTTKTLEESGDALIAVAKELKYVDNASAILIVNRELSSKPIVSQTTGDIVQYKEDE